MPAQVGERRSEKRLTKDGMSRPPLETELRSIHREAARLRQGKKGSAARAAFPIAFVY